MLIDLNDAQIKALTVAIVNCKKAAGENGDTDAAVQWHDLHDGFEKAQAEGVDLAEINAHLNMLRWSGSVGVGRALRTPKDILAWLGAFQEVLIDASNKAEGNERELRVLRRQREAVRDFLGTGGEL